MATNQNKTAFSPERAIELLDCLCLFAIALRNLPMLRFLHAADIHLDSPLRGLEKYEGAPVDEIRRASRRALENLVTLAIDERVAFVLITGDLYDADWPDYNTGLFFTHQMTKLCDAGIPVFLIAGNHDAANRMTKAVKHPANVTVLSDQKAETKRLDDFGVAVHGQGYATHAVTTDLSKAYPDAQPVISISACCTPAATAATRTTSPTPPARSQACPKGIPILGPGPHPQTPGLARRPSHRFPRQHPGPPHPRDRLQGLRLVTIKGAGAAVEHRNLDVIRWERCVVDAQGAEDLYDIVDRFSGRLASLVSDAEGRPLILRVEAPALPRA